MESTQTLLTIIVIALTLLLCVVGVQVVLVILDIRKALKRLNMLLASYLTGSDPIKLRELIHILRRKK